MLKKGLNGFELKIIALVLMTIDHIHYLFSGVLPIPVIFTMVGRLSAPLFFFMTANGMAHSKNREKYLIRLYIGALLMGFVDLLINQYFPHSMGKSLDANIFSTLWIVCLLIYSGENVYYGIKAKKIGKIILNAILFSIPFVSLNIFFALNALGEGFGKGVLIFLPSVEFTEGGTIFVALGIGFYLFRNQKVLLSLFYLYISGIFLLNGYDSTMGLPSLLYSFQWMMVFSLPLILLYNQKRGPSWKYLFYIYYPAHLIVFYLVSVMIAGYQVGGNGLVL